VNSLPMHFGIVGILVLLLALGGTYFIREKRVQSDVFDVPNQRSSHAKPTPRGGGLALIIAFGGGILIGWMFELIPDVTALCLGWIGTNLAFLGWLDDKTNLSAAPKFAHQLFATTAMLVGLYFFYPSVTDLGYLILPVALIGFLWLINLFNFMDGIDGIASVQAITSSIGLIVVFGPQNLPLGIYPALIFLICANLGFLFFNWPPASIFMGDVGSATLGGVMGVMMYLHFSFSAAAIIPWMIMLMPFLMDATVTLLRRWSRSERISQAHRSHAYQRASRYFHSHKIVTVGYACYTLIICMPLAWYSVTNEKYSFLCLLANAGCTGALVLYFGAGLPDNSGRHALLNDKSLLALDEQPRV
jgi:Fuc2NAc and GlcNAc transferase